MDEITFKDSKGKVKITLKGDTLTVDETVKKKKKEKEKEKKEVKNESSKS